MADTNPGPPEAASSVTSIATTDLVATPPAGPSADAVERLTDAEPLYPEGVPEPRGMQTSPMQSAGQGESADPFGGTGVEGEVIVWEATYSKRNFIGRTITRIVLTLAWVVLATYTWGDGHENRATLTWAAGLVVLLLWLALIVRVLQARYSHFYRLTNRRLFVSAGIFNRRRDMMELLTVKDVFTRQQSLFDRWLGLGTVVVVPNEKEIPTFYLTGVDDPKQVMDLIWHHARSERDHRSIKVDHV